MSGVVVRLAEVDDLAGVIALERGIAEAPHWADAEYAEMIGESGEAVRRCLFVAEVQGELIGFAVGKVIGGGADSVAELESVAVRVGARRSGIGRALCVAVVQWCRERGAATMELEVRAASAGAIALYSGLGFAEVGRRPGYYREPMDDALLMRLDLA